jgi:hypothetical protein
MKPFGASFVGEVPGEQGHLEDPMLVVGRSWERLVGKNIDRSVDVYAVLLDS